MTNEPLDVKLNDVWIARDRDGKLSLVEVIVFLDNNLLLVRNPRFHAHQGQLLREMLVMKVPHVP